ILCAVILSHRKAGHIRAHRRKRIRRGATAVHITEIESVSAGKIMINTYTELIVILAQGLRGNEAVFPHVWQREKRQNIRRSRIDRCEQSHLIERYRPAKKSELPIRIAAEAGGLVESGIEVGTLLPKLPCLSAAEGTVAGTVSPCRFRKPS